MLPIVFGAAVMPIVLGAIGAAYGAPYCWCCLLCSVLFCDMYCWPIVFDLYLCIHRSSVLYFAYFSQIHRVSIGMSSILTSFSMISDNVNSIRLIRVFPNQHLLIVSAKIKIKNCVFFSMTKTMMASESSYACAC